MIICNYDILLRIQICQKLVILDNHYKANKQVSEVRAVT